MTVGLRNLRPLISPATAPGHRRRVRTGDGRDSQQGEDRADNPEHDEDTANWHDLAESRFSAQTPRWLGRRAHLQVEAVVVDRTTSLPAGPDDGSHTTRRRRTPHLAYKATRHQWSAGARMTEPVDFESTGSTLLALRSPDRQLRISGHCS